MLTDERGDPVTPARIEALLAQFCYQSDTTSLEVGLVVKALRTEVDSLRSALLHRLVVRCVETTCPECSEIASLLDLTDDEFAEAAASQPS